MDLLDEIAKLSAFNYVLKTSTDNTYGMIHHMTGEWRGIIGDVISGVGYRFKITLYQFRFQYSIYVLVL